VISVIAGWIGSLVVIDLSSDEELKDPEYVPVGNYALCQLFAKKFYQLTPDDVCKVDRLWFLL